MPEISDRAICLPESPIRKLAPLANAAKKSGVKVYHLNIGQPDIKTPQVFFDAIAAADTSLLSYSPSAGIPTLREEVAKYYRRYDCDVASDDVLITTGASEGINFVLRAILDAGEEMIVPEPYYANYLSFTMANDGVLVAVPSSIENDFALPAISDFEAKITSKTRAIMICNPANPTGILYPKAALTELLDLVHRRDLFLIADEVYREFVYDGHKHHSVLSFGQQYENIIVIDSISKRFSACGARIGSVISKNQKLLQMILKMGQARLSPPTFGQIGAEAVFRLPEEYYQTNIAEYQKRRDVVLAWLQKIPGVVCPEINGAFYAMARLPVDDSDRFCEWMLKEFRHHNSTVMLAPGSGFYVTPGLGSDEVRIAYVLNCDDLTAAMECLEAGLAAYPGRTGTAK